jgi:aminoglycoside phosphotransferase (APT) family kinase protein
LSALRLNDPAPIDRDVALSPEWLTTAMQRAYPGVEISAVTVLGEMKTLATKLRFEVEYSEAPGDPPATLFMKGFFGEGAEARAWIGEPEARFFSELAPMLDARIPRAVYAATDDRTRHGLVILHDLVAEGAHFLTALSPYTVDQVEATLAELAKVHARLWDSPAIDNAWLEPEVRKFTDYRPVEEVQDLLDGERGTPLPSQVKDAERLRNAVIQVFAQTERERRCLVHGDAHAGNLYLDDDGKPGIVDWQIVSRGHWSFDVAYHVAAALQVPDRERAEVDLVRSYLDRMRGYGIDIPPWDDAWRAYQRALVYGYNLWVVTTTVDPRITHEFVYRLGTAAAAHGSMDLLGV